MKASVFNGSLPKIGLRPAIDGRLGGVRESLEKQTMDMAKSAAKLISSSLYYPNGKPVACVIADTCIGGVAEVAAAYRKLQQEQAGIHQAEIVTARLLNEVERARLTAEVAKLAQGKVDASFREDASLLGGAVVRIGSTVYDGSLRGRLDRLKEALVAG